MLFLLLLPRPGAGAMPGAADPVAAFDEANKLFEQAKYGAAADAYEQLVKMGQPTPSVLFNLGNARFKNGEPGRAIIAWLQAQRLAPHDERVRANLQFARRAVRGGEEGSEGFWVRTVSRLHANEWAAATATGVIALFLLLAAQEWLPARKDRLRTPAKGVAAATLLLGLAFWTAAQAERRTLAVVIVKEAAIRFTPLEESPVSFAAPDGVELTVVGRKGNGQAQAEWLEVQDAAERTGWVKRSQVAFVRES